jgi:hypothetical protein
VFGQRQTAYCRRTVGSLIVLVAVAAAGPACVAGSPSDSRESDRPPSRRYDIREGLTPRRMTIAMWDFSWLYGHYQGGPFEDFDHAIDELKQRGFNTVRIDAFPLLVDSLARQGQKQYRKPADPMATWGHSEKDVEHDVPGELLDFMRTAKRKGVFVILSSWGQGPKEAYAKREDFWRAWERVLDLLKENDLLSIVVYVDFDQEFPCFSPFASELERLGKEPPKGPAVSDAQAMEAAARQDSAWNAAQTSFVRDYFNETLKHFQSHYPELRFTFSLTGFWKEVRAMEVKSLDVLELHIWISSPRFENRALSGNLVKDRNMKQDHKDYMRRVRAAMQSVRPMLLGEMHNQLAFTRDWSRELAAPVVVTEAWGPWWHMDHADLEWDWLYDWCEQCMGLSSEYDFWGSTPWNFSHPYWKNWSNVPWYRKVNGAFLAD